MSHFVAIGVSLVQCDLLLVIIYFYIRLLFLCFLSCRMKYKNFIYGTKTACFFLSSCISVTGSFQTLAYSNGAIINNYGFEFGIVIIIGN